MLRMLRTMLRTRRNKILLGLLLGLVLIFGWQLVKLNLVQASGYHKDKGECGLRIFKEASVAWVTPGASIFYTIQISNQGDADCTGGGVEVQETYDPQVSVDNFNLNPTSGNDNWNFGTVEPGEVHTIVVNVTVAPAAEVGDVIHNQACAWAAEFGSKSDLSNWICAAVDIPVEEPPYCELTLDKSVDKTEITPGQELTYTIDITNSGTAVCSGGVEMNEFYSPAVAFVSSSPVPFAGDNIWNFGKVDAGVSHSVSVTVKSDDAAEVGDVIHNQACVWASDLGDKDNLDNWICDSTDTTVKVSTPEPEPDPEPFCNPEELEPGCECVGNAVQCSVPGQCQMIIDKNVDLAEVAPGGTLNYSINIANLGAVDCTGGGVELQDYYDSQASFVSSVPEPFADNFIWNFATVAPGESHSVAIEVTVDSGAKDGDVINNQACVWAAEQGDKENPANWICDEVITFVRVPDEQCPVITPPTDDFCPNGTIETSYGANQCIIGYECKPASEPEPEPEPEPNPPGGGCGHNCGFIITVPPENPNPPGGGSPPVTITPPTFSPPPESIPTPVVRGTTTEVFVPPTTSPRAGSSIPLTPISLGSLGGLITGIMAYLVSRKKLATS